MSAMCRLCHFRKHQSSFVIRPTNSPAIQTYEIRIWTRFWVVPICDDIRLKKIDSVWYSPNSIHVVLPNRFFIMFIYIPTDISCFLHRRRRRRPRRNETKFICDELHEYVIRKFYFEFHVMPPLRFGCQACEMECFFLSFFNLRWGIVDAVRMICIF